MYINLFQFSRYRGCSSELQMFVIVKLWFINTSEQCMVLYCSAVNSLHALNGDQDWNINPLKQLHVNSGRPIYRPSSHTMRWLGAGK